MNIGIIGLGVVGSACQAGFNLQGHRVLIHDPKFGTDIAGILDSEIVYVCIPTPTMPDGSCDLTQIETVIAQLKERKYSGVVAIKSTVTPGTTDLLMDRYGIDICFVPEFLREWCAYDDFVINHKLLAVGCRNNRMFEIVKQSHGSLPQKICCLRSTEAEILKYYSNVFNALRITFANNMFEICQAFDADYNKIKDAYLLRETATEDYMNCSEQLRGFGGMCLPKDTKVLIHLIESLGLELDLIKSIDHDNRKFKKTLHQQMRDCE